MHLENIPPTGYIDFFSKMQNLLVLQCNKIKSKNKKSKNLEFDSVKIITLLDGKKQKLKSLTFYLQTLSIKFLAKFVGAIISCLPSLKPGTLFYGGFEND